MPRWCVGFAAAFAVAVSVGLLVHAAVVGSMLALIYGVLGSCATASWLGFRRENAEGARVADGMFIMTLFFMFQAVARAFE